MGRFLHFFESLEEKRRLSHIKGLMALAAADGHIDDCEVDLVAEIATRIGLKEDEVTRIFKHPDSIKFQTPDSEEERLILLYDYIGVMLADKIIDEAELTFCYNTAEKLGLKSELTHEIVNKIITDMDKKLSMDDTLQTIADMLHK